MGEAPHERWGNGKAPEITEEMDRMAKKFFGISLSEAHHRAICIFCKAPIAPLLSTEADFREYHISGLCTICYDDACAVDESIAKGYDGRSGRWTRNGPRGNGPTIH